jgi:hypothetical protein
MRSGGSVSLSDARRADQPGKPNVPLKATIPGMAVAADTLRAAAIVAVARTRAAATVVVAGATHLVAAGNTPAGHGRCIPQRVRSVGGTLKFHSSRAPTSRYIAGSASSCGARQRLPGATITSPG